jgi:endonuclease III-like uncharacterized protein
MDTKLVTFAKINIGWNILFEVKLTNEEISNYDFRMLKDIIKDIEYFKIKFKDNKISFNCVVDINELHKDETIEQRLELLKKDVEYIAKSSMIVAFLD